MNSYQITETVSLPVREDNILRMCFEPFKPNKDKLLIGLEENLSAYGGKRIVDGIKFYHCKLDENAGFDAKKNQKAAEIKYIIPKWVLKTEGSCTYNTKKASDLEKHLLGVHSLNFKNYSFHCTHCALIFVDRSRASYHMNICAKLKQWASVCRSDNPIKEEFLMEYLYWTSDAVVLNKRPKKRI